MIVSTRGDERRDVPIHAMGGTGVFVKEVEQAVLDGRADVAVHSAKDLPCGDRARARARRPARAGRPSRRARRAAARRDPDGRPRRAPDRCGGGRSSRPCDPTSASRSCGATSRPGSRRRPASTPSCSRRRRSTGSASATASPSALDPSVVLPQVGQGALAVECRADDDETRELLAGVDDAGVRAAVTAERAYLAALGGGCNLPCGALAETGGDGIAAARGAPGVARRTHRAAGARRRPRSRRVGVEAARRLVDEEGGRLVLDDELGRATIGDMTVYLVGAGPGDPGLLTVRGAEVLGHADVVVYDRLVHPSLLDLAPPDAERVYVGKAPGRGRDRAGRHQRAPRRARARRDAPSSGSRAATRSCSGGAARRPRRWRRPACRSRSCPASPAPSARRRTPASP